MSDLRERVASDIRSELPRICSDDTCQPDDDVSCGCSYIIADAAISVVAEHLLDPAVVHANILAGQIAKPTLAQIVHIYGRDALLAELKREGAL